MTDFKISEIIDIVYVRTDAKIKSAACTYTAGNDPEPKKSHTMNVCDLKFQCQPSRSREYIKHLCYPQRRKC